jgi:segregation and condensation protein B
MSTPQQIEAILFAAARPLSIKKLAEISAVYIEDVEKGLVELEARLADSGIMLQRAGNEVQLVTRPEFTETIQKVLKDEMHGELTRPSLEALTILAYRGPLTRPELEQIRGVHSSLILRNLLLRGLIEEKEDARLGQPVYAVTLDFLRHMGLSSVEELPKYEELRGHQHVMDVLKDLEEKNGGADESQPSSEQITV